MVEIDSKTGILSALRSGLKGISAFVVWIGAAASGLGLILTACGFIITHAYLEALGVPRSVYEAKASEYVLVGGNFLMGLAPLTAIGILNVAVYAWWWVVLVLITSVVCWKWRFNAGRRLLLCTGLYTVWLMVSLSQFDANGTMVLKTFDANPSVLVSMFTALSLIALVYLSAEVLIVQTKGRTETAAVRLGVGLMGLVVLSSLVMLPYLRGTYATIRTHPLIEPLAGSYETFAGVFAAKSEVGEGDKGNIRWQLIQMGKNKVILRNINDGSLMIVPADAVKAFKIIPKASHKGGTHD